jgi:hypothetical protein
MRTPSRLMPKRQPPKLGAAGRLLLAALLAALAYLALQATPVQLAIAASVCTALWLLAARSARRTGQDLQALATSRTGESICEFARSFDCRVVDTWVIRAVYEELQSEVQLAWLPIRANDVLVKDLHIDPDDLDMSLAPAIAARTGRSLESAETNPYSGKVLTASDLVLFFNGQPRCGGTA